MVAKIAPHGTARIAGKGKVRGKGKAGAGKPGGGRYAEQLHPRDEHGHWIQTAGGIHRIKEGTPERRSGLAKQIRQARGKVKDKAGHQKLARQVRKLRATRRSRLVRAPEHPTAVPHTPAPTPHAVAPVHHDDKTKFVGKTVGKAEHVFADRNEKAIAAAVRGKQLDDNEPLDVRIRHKGGREDAIEVKALLKGSKRSISVHDDALLRKVEYVEAHPGATFHTVAADHRDQYEGGAHAENYSGNRLYYRRGSGAFALSTMYPVKDHAELRSLIAMPDHELPPKARGSLPSGDAVAKLRASAAKAHESRLNKDRTRKQRIKQANTLPG